nr:class I SAM-dependent methyltransferase [Sphingobium lignivorans]
MPTTTAIDRDHYFSLVAAYHGETTREQDAGVGEVHPEWAIGLADGRFLFDLITENALALTIEIGLCEGASAVHMAAAHAVSGFGLHFAIDPFQHEYFGGQGVRSIDRFGLTSWFRHIPERSDRSLSSLAAAGVKFDLIFIDGDHRFDAVFNDYYWSDKVLRDGGYLIFDEAGRDCPTKRVSSFIQNNMKNYELRPGPSRFYVYQKITKDDRGFGDMIDF